MTDFQLSPTPRRSALTIALRVLGWTLAVVPTLVFVVMAWRQRWISDDGFINLRVVHNFVRGNGLVFNLGERVESFTSTLWVLVLSLAGLLRIPLEPAAVVLGIVLGLAGLAFAQLGAFLAWSGQRRLSAIARAWMLPLGAAVFVALPPVWDHASAGLELGLVMAWLGLAFLVCVRAALRQAPAKLPWPSALVLGLGPLVRPELALFSLGMLLPLAVVAVRGHAGRRVRRLGVLLGSFAALPVGYQIFRMGYFAALTPNTALAKESMISNWDQGAHYFQNFFGLYHLLFPLGLLLVLWVLSVARIWRRENLALLLVVSVPIAVGALHALYVVKLGGDFMHARLFLPAVFCFVLPVSALPAVVDDMPAAIRAAIVAAAGVIAIWAVLVAALVRVDRENFHGIGDERGWYARMAGVDNPVRVDDYAKFAFYANGKKLNEIGARGPRLVVIDEPSAGRLQPPQPRLPIENGVLPESTRVVALRGALGIVGYAAGPSVHLVDLHGLSDPIASRLEIGARGRPGHEKRLSNYWFVARYAAAGGQDDLRVQTAREALACPELAELTAAVSSPLTLSRFVANIAAAFRLQDLRVPADPSEAKREFCGAGL